MDVGCLRQVCISRRRDPVNFRIGDCLISDISERRESQFTDLV